MVSFYFQLQIARQYIVHSSFHESGVVVRIPRERRSSPKHFNQISILWLLQPWWHPLNQRIITSRLWTLRKTQAPIGFSMPLSLLLYGDSSQIPSLKLFINIVTSFPLSLTNQFPSLCSPSCRVFSLSSSGPHTILSPNSLVICLLVSLLQVSAFLR